MGSLTHFLEVLGSKGRADLPETYGYRADTELGVGFWTETTTQCKVLEKPVVVPHGQDHYQGYTILYAYCAEEGLHQLLEGALPPILPATEKEPSLFPSLEAISENFGAKDPKAAAVNSKFCVPLRVPMELANKVTDVGPGRDIWMVRFDQVLDILQCCLSEEHALGLTCEDLISPFLQAAKECNVRKLRAKGCQGRVALVVVCQVEKLKAGLESGVKGNVVDEDGISALMMAATAGGAEACEVLLKGGAVVNHAERIHHRTALMCAAQGGHFETVKILLVGKADTTQADTEGQTALHWAAVAGHLEVARLLASLGQKGTKNAEDQTPADVAEKMGHTETAAALK